MSSPEDSSQGFNQQFSHLTDLAAWNHHAGGGCAWFRIERGTHGYDTTTWRLALAVERASGSTYTPAPDTDRPEWFGPGSEAMDIRYTRHRLQGAGAPTELEPLERLTSWARSGDGLAPPGKNVRAATMGRLCIRAANLAPSLESLGRVVQAYVDTMDHKQEAIGDDSRMSKAVVYNGLELVIEGGESFRTNPNLLTALAPVDAANQRHMRLWASFSESLGQFLIEEVPTKWTDEKKALTQAAALDAIQELEARGLLDDRWWISFGIYARGAIKHPALLPTVYEKLLAGDSEELIPHIKAGTAQALTRGYISELLDSYARDRQRSQVTDGDPKRNIDKIRETAQRGQRSPGTIGISTILTIAKNIAGGKRIFDSESMLGLGDALLLVLERTRSSDPEVAAQQFNQDVMHIEIIDILHHVTRERKAAMRREEITLDGLQRRYPYASAEELETIRGELTAGVPPATIRARYRGRHSGQPVISSYDIKSPGRGLLS